MTDMKEWIQNRTDEIALELTGHDFYDLGPHMQLMCCMKAEKDYTDYYSSLIDSIYEREKYRRIGC